MCAADAPSSSLAMDCSVCQVVRDFVDVQLHDLGIDIQQYTLVRWPAASVPPRPADSLLLSRTSTSRSACSRRATWRQRSRSCSSRREPRSSSTTWPREEAGRARCRAAKHPAQHEAGACLLPEHLSPGGGLSSKLVLQAVGWSVECRYMESGTHRLMPH